MAAVIEESDVRSPALGWLLLEGGRAAWEFGAYAAVRPLLRRIPAGDGHPVLVLPGLATSDFSTRPLRGFLRGLGYHVHGWRLGRNTGRAELLAQLVPRLHELRARHERRISLVGWSLGGIYAREIAKLVPNDVRLVITLGSPFAGPPHASNATRLYCWLSGRSATETPAGIRLAEPPPVPASSIYSRSDGVVAWQSCLERVSDTTENIRVLGSHCGLGHNPLALAVVADRLAQAEGDWKPFAPDAVWQRLAYRGD
jgi:pimeloyl-ACP methyl ester carboxylesterase